MYIFLVFSAYYFLLFVYRFILLLFSCFLEMNRKIAISRNEMINKTEPHLPTSVRPVVEPSTYMDTEPKRTDREKANFDIVLVANPGFPERTLYKIFDKS